MRQESWSQIARRSYGAPSTTEQRFKVGDHVQVKNPDHDYYGAAGQIIKGTVKMWTIERVGAHAIYASDSDLTRYTPGFVPSKW